MLDFRVQVHVGMAEARERKAARLSEKEEGDVKELAEQATDAAKVQLTMPSNVPGVQRIAVGKDESAVLKRIGDVVQAVAVAAQLRRQGPRVPPRPQETETEGGADAEAKEGVAAEGAEEKEECERLAKQQRREEKREKKARAQRLKTAREARDAYVKEVLAAERPRQGQRGRRGNGRGGRGPGARGGGNAPARERERERDRERGAPTGGGDGDWTAATTKRHRLTRRGEGADKPSAKRTRGCAGGKQRMRAKRTGAAAEEVEDAAMEEPAESAAQPAAGEAATGGPAATVKKRTTKRSRKKSLRAREGTSSTPRPP